MLITKPYYSCHSCISINDLYATKRCTKLEAVKQLFMCLFLANDAVYNQVIEAV